MKNYNNVDFSAKGIKDLEKMMIDLIEGSKDKGPSTEEIEPIKRGIDDLDGVSEEQKRANIKEIEKRITKEGMLNALNSVGVKTDGQ
jgi:hypothetical protein